MQKLHIENAYRIIPVYTADVSGVCSALFELGGMTVMHDPSGCNSTYNTHDETRWYEQDSLIYISGLTEIDAVMGNDRKLIDDVIDAANRLHPKFIALCGSPVPFLNGTDFQALARIIEGETSIPSFAVETNGTHDYVQGAGKALEKIAERFVKKPERKVENAVNILGMTPLDYAASDCVSSMRGILESAGMKVQSVWAMGDSLDALSLAGEASVNLVVSQTGMAAAKYMETHFQIPYVAGVPIGPVKDAVIEELKRAEKEKRSRILCSKRSHNGDLEVVIIGEPVTGGSLAWAISEKYGCSTRLFTPMEKSRELLGEGDLLLRGEAAMEEALREAKHIVADPLYAPVCPKESKFYELAHAAFSGRCYLREMPDLLKLLDE